MHQFHAEVRPPNVAPAIVRRTDYLDYDLLRCLRGGRGRRQSDPLGIGCFGSRRGIHPTGVRTRLDDALHYDGGLGMADLEASCRVSGNRPSCARMVWDSTCTELALWSWVFFAWQQPGWAFGEILILWFTIVRTIVSWNGESSRPAAFLMLPYLAWVTFASTLNGTIWRLNS